MSKLFRIDEACKYVNEKLELSVREAIDHHHVRWWRRYPMLKLPSQGQGKRTLWTIEQVKRLEKVAFLHIKLGVKLSKIDTAEKYLR